LVSLYSTIPVVLVKASKQMTGHLLVRSAADFFQFLLKIPVQSPTYGLYHGVQTVSKNFSPILSSRRATRRKFHTETLNSISTCDPHYDLSICDRRMRTDKHFSMWGGGGGGRKHSNDIQKVRRHPKKISPRAKKRLELVHPWI